ncbi:glycosyltransferase family 2 protein [Nostoc sp. FACHB-133]|uniref:glycosyltransferase family 2 protein n=1 Tax=Nostoc sp. FACHB-133 TaxID=2692835 RepID=UPI0016836670|nr:glycosyltransferase [Nostoc sp. FACHB-133]MBD2521548.1 glycosyltransferase family 2 protein [Nostoc sp. FACHB-133]
MTYQDTVKVHIVTYRRPHLLVRALKSLTKQTYTSWIAEVINDDPTDDSVNQVIKNLNDSRIFLSQPMIHRGGTENFNYAFRAQDTKYACLLEDDNWYQEDFLQCMISALTNFPNIELACANEIIWKEEPDGSWLNTQKTIWKYDNDFELFKSNLLDKCGSAKICNSSMFWRTKNSPNWQTPQSIPIDVTEHFRERIIPHPILLVKKPLVNYAETIDSYRSSDVSRWGSYQVLLIGSIFETVYGDMFDMRQQLADSLWQKAFTSQKQLYTSLLFTGLVFKEAKILWSMCPLNLKLRFLMTLVRRPVSSLLILKSKILQEEAYKFLVNSKNFT